MKYLMKNTNSVGRFDTVFTCNTFEQAIKFFKQENKRLHLKESSLLRYTDRDINIPLAIANSGTVFIQRRQL